MEKRELEGGQQGWRWVNLLIPLVLIAKILHINVAYYVFGKLLHINKAIYQPISLGLLVLAVIAVAVSEWRDPKVMSHGEVGWYSPGRLTAMTMMIPGAIVVIIAVIGFDNLPQGLREFLRANSLAASLGLLSVVGIVALRDTLRRNDVWLVLWRLGLIVIACAGVAVYQSTYHAPYGGPEGSQVNPVSLVWVATATLAISVLVPYSRQLKSPGGQKISG